jgi:SAM-dependent methyltransferase
MSEQVSNEVEIQRQYYKETAHKYDEMHVGEKDEHYFSLAFLTAALDYLEVNSILDVGSGTGRALKYLKDRKPNLRLVGVEPVRELREVGYRNGLTETELVEGDATKLPFVGGEFDVVCEFGVLHHIKKPETAVAEMLRVAGRAIFISDSNNFGQGSLLGRSLKQLLGTLGIWKVADLIKTRGKGYMLSEGDGLAYSYSVFNNYKLIKKACKSVHVLNTMGSGINPYRTAGHVALLGIK